MKNICCPQSEFCFSLHLTVSYFWSMFCWFFSAHKKHPQNGCDLDQYHYMSKEWCKTCQINFECGSLKSLKISILIAHLHSPRHWLRVFMRRQICGCLKWIAYVYWLKWIYIFLSCLIFFPKHASTLLFAFQGALYDLAQTFHFLCASFCQCWLWAVDIWQETRKKSPKTFSATLCLSLCVCVSHVCVLRSDLIIKGLIGPSWTDSLCVPD